jgi:outer membrane cobalamin receptor
VTGSPSLRARACRRLPSPPSRVLSPALACLVLATVSAAARADGESSAPAPVPVVVGADSLWLDLGDAAFYGGMLDTVVVAASRPLDMALAGGPAVVTVVPLENEAGGADLGELLARVAGLQIRRYGGLGAETVPSLRGASAGHIVVMIDGMPLSDAQSQAIDLSSLPLERFGAAEIQRGLSPARNGGIGGVGAINLVTRPEMGAGTDVRLFAGSYGDAGGRIFQGWDLDGGRWRGHVLAHGRRIANRFDFLFDNQTVHNPDDDYVRDRRNAQFSEYGLHVAGRGALGRPELSAAAGYFRRDGGTPGPVGSFERTEAVVRRERGDLRLGLRDAGDRWSLDLAAASGAELLHDEEGKVYAHPVARLEAVRSDLAGRARAGCDLVRDRVRWLAGGSWQRQWYRETWDGERNPLRRRTTVTAFSELTVSLAAGRVALMPAWRWQRATDDFPPVDPLGRPWLEEPLAAPRAVEAVSPSVGLVHEAVAGRLWWEAHWSRSSRLPSWIELFGHLGGVRGNRMLEPEVATSRDVALRWAAAGDALRLRLALFAVTTEGTVIYVESSPLSTSPRNFGRTRSRGLELEGVGKLPGGGRWSGSVTWQDARFLEAREAYVDKELPFLPPLEASLRLERPLGPWRPSLSLVHEAAAWRDQGETELYRAEASTLWGLALARSWETGGRLVTATVEVVNLTDEQVHDIQGFPLPGRSYRASLQLR